MPVQADNCQRETPPPVETPSAPLPEAPVSITLKATLHGHEVMVTLRGVDFASVKAQVEHASAWLRAQAPGSPQGQPQGQGDTPQCPTHGLLRQGKRGWFCPHKLADDSWCKSRA